MGCWARYLSQGKIKKGNGRVYCVMVKLYDCYCSLNIDFSYGATHLVDLGLFIFEVFISHSYTPNSVELL